MANFKTTASDKTKRAALDFFKATQEMPGHAFQTWTFQADHTIAAIRAGTRLLKKWGAIQAPEKAHTATAYMAAPLSAHTKAGILKALQTPKEDPEERAARVWASRLRMM